MPEITFEGLEISYEMHHWQFWISALIYWMRRHKNVSLQICRKIFTLKIYDLISYSDRETQKLHLKRIQMSTSKFWVSFGLENRGHGYGDQHGIVQLGSVTFSDGYVSETIDFT